MWLFDHGKEQNEMAYIHIEYAVLVGSVSGDCP
jgi:hypothetical protein